MTNYNLYKTFITVVEEKNITKASNKLYISQPAISFNIKQLESELGGELFERTNKGVIPTHLGEELYKRVKPIINQLDSLDNFVNEEKNLDSGILRIGAYSSNTNQLLGKYLTIFAKTYPKVKIVMERLNQKDLISRLEDGSLDIAFLDMDNYNKNFEVIKRQSVYYQLIGNKDYYSKYAGIKIDSENFPSADLILPNQNNKSRKCIDEFFKKNGVNINNKYELDNYILLYEFVKQGLGIAFVSTTYYEDDINNGVVFVLDPSFKVKAHEFELVHNIEKTNFTKQAFINLIKSIE